MSDRCPKCGAECTLDYDEDDGLRITDWECGSTNIDYKLTQSDKCRIRELESALAVVHEHRLKTRKVADERMRNVGQDGLTIQLQSEATLMDVLCPTDAGKQIAERLIKLEATVVERDAKIAELVREADHLRALVVSGTRDIQERDATIADLRERIAELKRKDGGS